MCGWAKGGVTARLWRCAGFPIHQRCRHCASPRCAAVRRVLVLTPKRIPRRTGHGQNRDETATAVGPEPPSRTPRWNEPCTGANDEGGARPAQRRCDRRARSSIVTFDRHSHRGPPNANLRWPLDGAARPHRGGVSIKCGGPSRWATRRWDPVASRDRPHAVMRSAKHAMTMTRPPRARVPGRCGTRAPCGISTQASHAASYGIFCAAFRAALAGLRDAKRHTAPSTVLTLRACTAQRTLWETRARQRNVDMKEWRRRSARGTAA